MNVRNVGLTPIKHTAYRITAATAAIVDASEYTEFFTYLHACLRTYSIFFPILNR